MNNIEDQEKVTDIFKLAINKSRIFCQCNEYEDNREDYWIEIYKHQMNNEDIRLKSIMESLTIQREQFRMMPKYLDDFKPNDLLVWSFWWRCKVAWYHNSASHKTCAAAPILSQRLFSSTRYPIATRNSQCFV